MTVVGEAWVRILPDSRTFAPALTEEVVVASEKAGAAGGIAAGEAFGASFGKVLKSSLAIVGITAGVELVKKSIEAVSAHAGAIAVLDRATKNARASNTLYGESLEQLIRKEAILKGFNDESLYQSFTRLVGVTHDSAKAYKDLQLAEDVARGRHIDVAIAALALSKAEQGSVTSLQRLGIVLPKNITSLDRTAKATAALALVQRRFGGESVAFANSSAGATQRLSEDVHILTEAFGEALLPEVESVSKSLSRYLSNQENLDKIQRDVEQGAHGVAFAAHEVGQAFKIADATIVPAVDALGGFGKVAEVVLGAVFLRKILQATKAFAGLFATTVAGEAASAGATSAYTAALIANTDALIANAGAQKLRLGGLGTSTGGFGKAGGVAVVGEEAAAAAPAIEGAAVSAAGLASVLSGPMVIGAALAGYGLSKLIRQIPGWNSFFDSLGSHAEKAAEKLGLVGAGAPKAGSPGSGSFTGTQFAANQAKLADAYQQAINQKVPGFARDAFVENAVGKAYNFHDAQIAAEHLGKALVTKADTLLDQTLRRAAQLAANVKIVKPPRTDTDYKIAVQRALLTSSTDDELALYTQRAKYIDRRIATMQKDATLSAAEKKTLLRLESERAQLQSDITTITETTVQNLEDNLSRQETIASGTVGTSDDRAVAQKKLAFEQQQAKNAKLTLADRRRYADEAIQTQAQIAQTDNQLYAQGKQTREQALQYQAARAQLTQDTLADDKKAARDLLAFYRTESHDSKLALTDRQNYQQQARQQQLAIVQLDRDAYRHDLATREQKLQLNIQRAQLTRLDFADDKATQKKLIAFYTKEAHDAKLSQAERLDYQSKAIQARIALQGQSSPATVAQIFGEAASEFRNYGSNIAGRNGILSGQDERARFSQLLLEHQKKQGEAQTIRHIAAYTEAQRQTGYLARIAQAVAPVGTKDRPPAPSAAGVRRLAKFPR